jgi:hypothetical protein
VRNVDGRFVVSLAFDDEQAASEFEQAVLHRSGALVPMPPALVIDPGKVIGSRPGNVVHHVNYSSGTVHGTLVQHYGDVHGGVTLPD